MRRTTRIDVGPGIVLWREALDDDTQQSLLAEILKRAETGPFYRPRMPISGKPFSVEMTNFGPLGWVSDEKGYRYSATHPQTGEPWPPIPAALLALWKEATVYPAEPECCLVNLYRGLARMGLHQDKDEKARDAPVLSVSLDDMAQFRICGATRRGSTKSLKLASGDVLTFGGPARLAYHGIDRVMAGTSRLVPGGGRINLTLRRINALKSKTPDQGADRASLALLRAGCREGMTDTRRKDSAQCASGGAVPTGQFRPSED